MLTATAILFQLISAQYQLPENLLSSLCYVESKHIVSAIHYHDGTTNSVGICQIKLKTAKWLGFKGSEIDLMRPEVNIEYAAKYLKYQIRRYNSIPKAVIAYNRGRASHLNQTNYSLKVLAEWNLRRKHYRVNNFYIYANTDTTDIYGGLH